MNTDLNRCLSEQELAVELGLSYWTVRQLRLQEGLPHFCCGRRVFYRWASVNDWLNQKEQNKHHPVHNPIRAI